MKKLIFFLTLAISTFSLAQKTYTVNNQTLELKTEVDGTLDLLWNTIDSQYRYFIKSEDNTLTELVNTKGNDNKYDNAYQSVLNNLTGMDASKTKLTLYSLKAFINKYNASKNSDYTYDSSKPKLKTRLGVFGGITNNPFVLNPKNDKVPFFGAELELFQDTERPKHAGFLNIRATGKNGTTTYTSSQIALGYRFRFINKEGVNIYAQTKFATFIASKSRKTTIGTGSIASFNYDESNTAFDIPLIFGIGADFKVGNGFITLVADSLFGLFVNSADNFPIDVALGYKFNL